MPAYHVIAQAFPQIDGAFPDRGTEGGAFQIVNGSIELARATAQSWSTAWDEAFNTVDGGLWAGILALSRVLVALSILYLAVREGSEIIQKQSWVDLARIFVWPLVIVFFLSNNGSLLAGTVQTIRSLGYTQTQQVLNFQLGELTFRDAITRQGLTSVVRDEIQNLYAECQGLVGEELFTCWDEKQERAREILAAAERTAGQQLLTASRFVEGVINRSAPLTSIGTGTLGGVLSGQSPSDALGGATAGVIRDYLMPLIRGLIYGLQWMVVNLLEGALLLTGLFAPIAMSLSLLPFQGRPILAWLIGFISLFGVQIGYNIVVGLVATRVVESGGEIPSDLGFSLFLAIGAPALSLLICGSGGLAIYRGVSGNLKQMIDFASGMVGVATTTAIRAAIR